MSKSNQTFSSNPAPKDGTPIKARGRVIGPVGSDIDDDGPAIGICSEPFEAVIQWRAEEGQFPGWHFVGSGLSVASMVEDRVYVDEWQPFFPVTKTRGLTIQELRSKVARQHMRTAALEYRESIHPGGQYGHSGPFMFEHNCAMAVRQLQRAKEWRRQSEEALANAA